MERRQWPVNAGTMAADLGVPGEGEEPVKCSAFWVW